MDERIGAGVRGGSCTEEIHLRDPHLVDPWEELAQAIVMLGVEDYREAAELLRRNPEDVRALRARARLERFFRSEWFQVLGGSAGEIILRRLREEAAA